MSNRGAGQSGAMTALLSCSGLVRGTYLTSATRRWLRRASTGSNSNKRSPADRIDKMEPELSSSSSQSMSYASPPNWRRSASTSTSGRAHEPWACRP